MESRKGSSPQEVKLLSQYDEYIFKTDLREAKHTFVKNTLVVASKKRQCHKLYSVSTDGLSTCHVA